MRYIGVGIEFSGPTDMKRTIASAAVLTTLTTAASAADLPRRALPPAPLPRPVFTWTGAYFGLAAGYVASTRDVVSTAGAFSASNGSPIAPYRGAIRLPRDGFTGGGQLGYNYQITPGSGFVVGAEADIAYTDLRRTDSFNSTVFGTNTDRQSGDSLGTVRGRAGYAVDRTLFYGTGGLAYASDAYRSTLFQAAGQPALFGRRSSFETGYAAGGGIEYALPTDSVLNVFHSSAVTVKGEALYYDLGSRTVPVLPVRGGASVLATRFQNEGVLGRVGVNYKFGSF